MIKSVAFDLWETLITNTPEASEAQKNLRIERMERILRDRGYRGAAEKIEHAHRESWHRCQELYWSSDRDIDTRVQVEHFLEALHVSPKDLPMDALEDAYARVAIDVLPDLVPGAADVIRDLKKSGYSIGLISNTGRTPGYALREILDALQLSRFIDAMVFSNEHGFCKPVPSIFETLRAALGSSFNEMVFIGDNPYVDVYGAQRCGMKAVHFTPPKRGLAIAPPVEHELEIVPDATINDLRALPALVHAWNEASSATSTSRASADEQTGTR